MTKHRKRLLFDSLVVCASIAVAIILSKGPLIDILLTWAHDYYILAAFIAGAFFTSIFTTPPAIAILAQLAVAHDPIVIALLGGAGALLGDLVIFSFMKHHVREDVAYFLSKAKTRRIRHILEHRFVRWSLALVGALIISSPLPDELGLALMGVSGIQTKYFVPTSYVFNVIGILLIAFIARSI